MRAGGWQRRALLCCCIGVLAAHRAQAWLRPPGSAVTSHSLAQPRPSPLPCQLHIPTITRRRPGPLLLAALQDSSWGRIDGYGEVLRRCAGGPGVPPLAPADAVLALERLVELGAQGLSPNIVRDDRFLAFLQTTLPATLEPLAWEDPPSLLRLVGYLARLGAPATALSPGFWDRWEQSLARPMEASPDKLFGALEDEQLAALSVSLVCLGYAPGEIASTSGSSLLQAWLEALAARSSTMSLKGWATAMEGVVGMGAAAVAMPDQTREALARGMLRALGSTGGDEEIGAEPAPLPRLWRATTELHWFGGRGNDDNATARLLLQRMMKTAEQQVAAGRYGTKSNGRILDCLLAVPPSSSSAAARLAEAIALAVTAPSASLLPHVSAQAHCRLLRALRPHLPSLPPRTSKAPGAEAMTPAALRLLWTTFLSDGKELDAALTAEDLILYAEDAAALTLNASLVGGDATALPPLVRRVARALLFKEAVKSECDSDSDSDRTWARDPARRLLALCVKLRCSPGREFVEEAVVVAIGRRQSSPHALDLPAVAGTLYALALLDLLLPARPGNDSFWDRVTEQIRSPSDVSSVALALWSIAILRGPQRAWDAAVNALAMALEEENEEDSGAPSLPLAAGRQALQALTAVQILEHHHGGGTTGPSLSLTAAGARLQQRLAAEVAATPTPPPSPSKLQTAVRACLLEGLGVARLEEEVGGEDRTDDDTAAASLLPRLGYTVDFLIHPRPSSSSLRPVALEVDGPHHFLAQEAAAGISGSKSSGTRTGKRGRRKAAAAASAAAAPVPSSLRPLGPTKLKRRVLEALCSSEGWAGFTHVSYLEWQRAVRLEREKELLREKMAAIGLNPFDYFYVD